MSNLVEIPSPETAADSHDMMELFLNALAYAIADRLEHRLPLRRRLLTVEEAAEYLSTSEDTIHRLVTEGRLTPVRLNRRVHFDIRELHQLIEEAKKRRA